MTSKVLWRLICCEDRVMRVCFLSFICMKGGTTVAYRICQPWLTRECRLKFPLVYIPKPKFSKAWIHAFSNNIRLVQSSKEQQLNQHTNKPKGQQNDILYAFPWKIASLFLLFCSKCNLDLQHTTSQLLAS